MRHPLDIHRFRLCRTRPALAGASTLIALEIDWDRLGKVVAEVADILLGQSLSRNDYFYVSDGASTFCQRFRTHLQMLAQR